MYSLRSSIYIVLSLTFSCTLTFMLVSMPALYSLGIIASIFFTMLATSCLYLAISFAMMADGIINP